MTDALQTRVEAWHRQRFPHATPTDVVLKALSELGEVADAVLGDDLGGKGDVAQEAADVVVALLALVAVYTDGDLLALVAAKLDALVARAEAER